MCYLIDVGSSTIKVYKRYSGKVSLIESKSFNFKDNFDAERGLSVFNKTELTVFFSDLIKRLALSRSNTKIFATGIFRDFLYKQSFVEEFYIKTGLYFNIISHALETFYLEKALIGKDINYGSWLVINIGGRTTELLFYSQGSIIERRMLSLGVGTILKEYPSINNDRSLVALEEIVQYVRSELPSIRGNIKTLYIQVEN